MDTFDKTARVQLGEKLKEARLASKYTTRKALASQAGLSEEGLRKMEKGIRVPDPENLLALCKALKLPQQSISDFVMLRNKAHAERDGVDIIPGLTNNRLTDASSRVLDFVEESMLKPNDMFIGKKERDKLVPLLRSILRDSLEV